jgi:hypothetical protein
MVIDAIREMLAELFRRSLSAEAGGSAGDAPTGEILTQYLVGAYMGVLTWWLDRGARIPPREMDRMLQRLAPEGLR